MTINPVTINTKPRPDQPGGASNTPPITNHHDANNTKNSDA